MGNVEQGQLAKSNAEQVRAARQVIEGLEALYPGIAARALADDSLKPGLAVSINGTISRRGLRGAVPEGAEVHFLPALGGG